MFPLMKAPSAMDILVNAASGSITLHSVAAFHYNQQSVSEIAVYQQ
jgi:hypothetical protein